SDSALFRDWDQSHWMLRLLIVERGKALPDHEDFRENVGTSSQKSTCSRAPLPTKKPPHRNRVRGLAVRLQQVHDRPPDSEYVRVEAEALGLDVRQLDGLLIGGPGRRRSADHRAAAEEVAGHL